MPLFGNLNRSSSDSFKSDSHSNESKDHRLNSTAKKTGFFETGFSEKIYRDDLREILVQIHGLPKLFLGIKKKTSMASIEPR